MICELCNKPIVDNNFMVGVGPDMTEVSEMSIGHTTCVKRITDAIIELLNDEDELNRRLNDED